MVHNHGDLILYPSKVKAPKTAKHAKLHILQDSGVTGNRHEVISKLAPVYRWTKGDNEYISCAKAWEIRHVGGDEEHGVQKLTPGTYEVRHEDEYNPWSHELRRVLD